ncbi:hypothetical protein HMPREF0063_12679 [Aeromicrobium marinum DSM 15272]|uniref:Phosphopantetheine adenylyltransferase n=1 Tax=Aeromicrobium marinum DSM 15272 TaxID=585531 RepID=E2SF70_9ACTN|nr:hypothetical protein [Aeromicrobium marinum]EFQ82155.1 hypothetical protein HMPREF0063_12679 [Aeromicrobium marinum DSM 15272]
MEVVIGVLLVVAAVIHALPVIGVVSSERVAALYAITVDGTDLAVLLRHRAVLFGVLAGLLVAAVLDPDLRGPVAVAVLVSDLAFAALAIGAREIGRSLRRVLVADIVSIIALVGVIGLLLA